VMLREGTGQGIFGHCVMTTMWNLMARVKNGVGLCRTHFEVDGDALLIYYAQEKTDHQGRKARDPRHVYANPFMPEICPILSLGLYFVMIDVTSFEEELIFPGREVAKAFNDYLRGVLENKEKMGEFVEPEVKRGSHSLRKGAATFASSGGTNAPSHAAISDRGGWSIGTVQKIYLQYEKAGDQHVGRTVCGLNGNDETFGVLPPRFKQGKEYEDVVNEVLKDCFSKFGVMKPEFQRVLKMVLAFVCYHLDRLRNDYFGSMDHEMRSKTIYTKRYRVPLPKIVEIPEWRPGDAMQPTGLTPVVLLDKRLKIVEKRDEEMRIEMFSDLKLYLVFFLEIKTWRKEEEMEIMGDGKIVISLNVGMEAEASIHFYRPWNVSLPCRMCPKTMT